MSGIAVFNKAVNRLQESQKNLLAISRARQKLEQENELFKLKKQEAQINLDKAKMEGRLSELQYDVLKNQNKQYLKQEEDRIKGNVASINIAEDENKNLAQQAMHWAKVGFRSNPSGVMAFLDANRRYEGRTKELRPKFSYGQIGYEEVDVNNGQDAETEKDRLLAENRRLDIERKKRGLEPSESDELSLEKKRLDVQSKRAEMGDTGISEKDVLDKAMALAKEDESDKPYKERVKDNMSVARDLLYGKSKGDIQTKKMDDKTEARIQRDMKHYGKTREEIIAAYKRKNIL